MERNADDMFVASGDQSSTTDSTNSFGSTGAGLGGNTAPMGGSNYSTSNSPAGTTDMSRADQAKAAVQDKLGQVKEKARDLSATLADRLDAGAEKIHMAQVQDSVARGMTKSADWLRNGDLKTDIGKQVRENPGRTLLIALGVGYVLGKVFRNNR